MHQQRRDKMEQHIPHNLTLTERKSMTMTGVTEVIRFDECSVLLRTALGTLLVQGQDLQLKQLTLDGGNVAVDGQISALSYEEPRQGSWLSRLLK